jgi:hypothetical protein
LLCAGNIIGDLHGQYRFACIGIGKQDTELPWCQNSPKSIFASGSRSPSSIQRLPFSMVKRRLTVTGSSSAGSPFLRAAGR